MNHLDIGLLRRALDEPHALPAPQRRHLDGCIACRRQTATLRARAEVAANALGATTVTRTLRPLARPGTAVTARRANAVWWYACAAAVVAVVLFAQPLRTFAQSFLAIFEPRQFVAVPVSAADVRALRTLPDLGRYGTMRRLVAQRSADAPDAASAARLANIPVRVPAFVPPEVTGRPMYRVVSRATTAFTFSIAKAAAAAAAAGKTLPVAPRGLDGSTLEASVGPAVLTVYATPGERASFANRGGHEGGWPKLLVAQMPAPVVVSSGVSAATLLEYLASQPGLPPQLAAELRGIADPTSTLPIPIPIDRVTATPASVQGVPGLGIGDNTGIGAGIVWQRGGFVYGVAGTLPARTILAIANSLR